MQLIDGGKESDTDTSSASGVGGPGGSHVRKRRIVVVGVKFDKQSTQLLTWALVQVAQPGDLVLALHVLDASNEKQSTLLALLQTFDSVLSVYEGFCNLKQVELKLKVSRGLRARKILVREAKRHQSAVVVVGTSKARNMVQSRASVAKYCARKLPNTFSVLAVHKGKAVFRREPSSCATLAGDDDGRGALATLTRWGSGTWKPEAIRKYFGCASTSKWKDTASDTCFESDAEGGANCSSLASASASVSASLRESGISQEQSLVKPSCPSVQRNIFPKQPISDKALTRKTLRVSRLSRIPLRHFSKAIHSDVKHGDGSAKIDQHFSGSVVDNGATVSSGSSATSSPRSPDHRLGSLPKQLAGLHSKFSSNCKSFSFQELVSATSNFVPERLVGKGGNSKVFRGFLPDGQEVAVKILNPSDDVLKEFLTEIEIITAINHKNVISLVGYCFEGSNLILVYDYLPRGSLEENLHDNKKDAAFGWKQRYKVAVGVAEALDHLHNACPQSVIHRDVKSSNILLSNEFQPQLADFGLASLASNDSSFKVYTDVAGTFGYLAPEYFMHGKVTEKIDVYAYGVVLLELLSGQKPISSGKPNGAESLVKWATPILLDGKISKMLDTSIGSDYDRDHIERMVLAATLCIRRAPQFRPGISLILKLLRGDVEVTTWAKQQVNGGSSTADSNTVDGETFPSNIQSFLNTAFLDVEDDALSLSSPDRNISLEEYLQGRWSRSPSFH